MMLQPQHKKESMQKAHKYVNLAQETGRLNSWNIKNLNMLVCFQELWEKGSSHTKMCSAEYVQYHNTVFTL